MYVNVRVGESAAVSVRMRTGMVVGLRGGVDVGVSLVVSMCMNVHLSAGTKFSISVSGRGNVRAILSASV